MDGPAAWLDGPHPGAMLALVEVAEAQQRKRIGAGRGCLGAGRQRDCMRESASRPAQVIAYDIKARAYSTTSQVVEQDAALCMRLLRGAHQDICSEATH